MVDYGNFNNCENIHNKSKFCNLGNTSNYYLANKIGDTGIMSLMRVMSVVIRKYFQKYG